MTTPPAEALAQAARRLTTMGGLRDARLLLAYVLDMPVSRIAVLDAPLSGTQAEAFEKAVMRRVAGEPISHILGRRAFWKHDFHVNADVLDPRPETELLVELALAEPFDTVLDLGTGSGCILLSLLAERPSAKGMGVDVSQAALDVADRNRIALGLDARAELRLSDWFGSVTDRFDLIVANPPYIDEAVYHTLAKDVREFEPRVALTPGVDGTAPYRSIATGAMAHLTDSGRVLVEIGYDQGPRVSALFAASGFRDICVHKDLDGRDRVVAARNPR